MGDDDDVGEVGGLEGGGIADVVLGLGSVL
jgi:hypothetical protein